MSRLLCRHCGQPIPKSFLEQCKTEFCCSGCEMVFRFLSQNGLERYYELKEQLPSLSPVLPVSVSSDSFAFLDQLPYVPLVQFYLEGVHCAACLWLVEKVPRLLPGVKSSRLELGKNRATFEVDSTLKLSELASVLQNLGYKPHLIEGEAGINSLREKEDRRLLIQLGIAGAIAGNIMIFSVGLYTGASGQVAEFFRWLCFVLALPVVFYSAIPFYKATLAAVRLKTMSMDVPVAISVIVGFLMSTWHLIIGKPHIYFDCIAMLVFLLLSTRYFLRRVTFWAVDSSQLVHYLAPKFCERLDSISGRVDTVHTSKLSLGDTVRVGPGLPIPVDGRVVSGKSWVNMSAMTGESEPQPVQEESTVYCGTVNGNATLDICVERVGSSTRLGRLLVDIESSPQAHFVTLADHFSRYLLLGVSIVAVCLVVFFGAKGQFSEGLNRALALMVITCPCALAIATPLSFSIAVKRCASRGVLIKNSDCIEKINAVNTVIFDKTGTLTFGNLEVVKWLEEPNCPSFIKSAVWALEQESDHPVAGAIRRYLDVFQDDMLLVEAFEERVGLGVFGRVKGCDVFVGRGKEYVEVRCNDQLVVSIVLSDQIRPDTRTTLTSFRLAGFKTILASGDVKSTVQRVATELAFNPEQVFPIASPEFKTELVRAHSHVLMVGDGANDAAALLASDIGVAVHGSLEVSMRASDVYVLSPGIVPVWQFVQESFLAIRLIRFNLAISFVYNVSFIVLSVCGYVSPLVAAIVMPVSSLFVVLVSTSAFLKKI